MSIFLDLRHLNTDADAFAQDHPGGAQIILKYAGKDATGVYDPIHPPDALEKNLPMEKHLGPLNDDAAGALALAQESRPKTKDELRVEAALKQRLPLHRILSLADMEVRRCPPHDDSPFDVIFLGRSKESLVTQGVVLLQFSKRRRDK